VESLGEIVDMELVGRITPTEVQERLNEKMSQGIRIVEAKEVPLDSSPSSVKPRSVYWIQLHPLILRGEAMDKLKSALAEEELIVQQRRKGKERRVDIRPFIEKMEIKRYPPGDRMIPEGEEKEEGENNLWGVELVLQSSGGRTAKPTEILGAVLDLDGEVLSQCKVIKIE
jgi:radical SAM-linked protein